MLSLLYCFEVWLFHQQSELRRFIWGWYSSSKKKMSKLYPNTAQKDSIWPLNRLRYKVQDRAMLIKWNFFKEFSEATLTQKKPNKVPKWPKYWRKLKPQRLMLIKYHFFLCEKLYTYIPISKYNSVELKWHNIILKLVDIKN